jgi:excinuclease UvrABC nuclease subunit
MGSYVYFLIDKEGSLLYVGQTTSLYSRIEAHKKEHSWSREIQKIKYCECKNKTDMEFYEMYYINKLKPKYNKTSVKSDSPSFDLPELEFKDYDEFLLSRQKRADDESISNTGTKATFYVKPELFKQLKIMAANKERTLSSLANEALREFMETK